MWLHTVLLASWMLWFKNAVVCPITVISFVTLSDQILPNRHIGRYVNSNNYYFEMNRSIFTMAVRLTLGCQLLKIILWYVLFVVHIMCTVKWVSYVLIISMIELSLTTYIYMFLFWFPTDQNNIDTQGAILNNCELNCYNLIVFFS